MEKTEIENSTLLTSELKVKYNMSFEDNDIIIAPKFTFMVNVPYARINRIDSNGTTVTFYCKNLCFSIWINSVITLVNIF